MIPEGLPAQVVVAILKFRLSRDTMLRPATRIYNLKSQAPLFLQAFQATGMPQEGYPLKALLHKERLKA